MGVFATIRFHRRVLASASAVLATTAMFRSPRNPAWYLNLQSEPQVTVQVGERNIAVVAKTADAEGRARLWNRLVAKTPIYKRFQDRTSRQIPVVYLMPVDSGVEA